MEVSLDTSAARKRGFRLLWEGPPKKADCCDLFRMLKMGALLYIGLEATKNF